VAAVQEAPYAERRTWTAWTPPARRSAWDAAVASAAIALMIGAVLAGDALGPSAGAVGAWLPQLGPAVGALAARLAPARVPAIPAEEAPASTEGLDQGAFELIVDDASPAAGLRLVREGPPAWTDLALENKLGSLATAAPGRVSVAVRHVPTGASALLDADTPMSPASVFKLGVLGEIVEQRAAGTLSLDERLWLLPEDWADGAGILQWRIGESITVREAARLMIAWSDNIAANALLRRVGYDGVNRFYAAHDMPSSHIYPDYRPDVTTAAETAALLARLVTGQLAGDEDSSLMLQYLAQWQPAAWVRDGLPGDVTVAHKSGQLPGIRNDAAIVYAPSGPYVVVVLTDRLTDDFAGEAFIARVADLVHTHLQESYPAGLFGAG
jgi:beta-lactamase class A